MAPGIKDFKTYEEQVDLLIARGMDVGDRGKAIAQLERVNYYRLSGYWYPFRQLTPSGKRTDDFYPGASLDDVVVLYDFDARLRTAVFDALTPVELALRAAIGHALGEVHECAHLHPQHLSSRAQGDSYQRWIDSYYEELDRSREDFVGHHKKKYGGTLPVWAAVEILDWGSLTYLFNFSSSAVQSQVADAVGLSSPQLHSWMKCLNLVRNTCAHHGRLFNRAHVLTPKLPQPRQCSELDLVRHVMNRTFGQLSLIQYLRTQYGIQPSRMLSAVIRSYPTQVGRVPVSHVGVPEGWEGSPLWGS